MAELKPCPFCGGKPTAAFPIMSLGEKGGWNVIMCLNPKCRIQPSTDWHKSKSVVVREWNRRAENG